MKLSILKEINIEKETQTIATEVINTLINEQKSIATAESCTGGLIASYLTDIPGASKVFHGAIVTYCNEWKQNYLKVTNECLEKYGAVSEECAKQMVEGLANTCNTNANIAVTGIAGPGGGSKEKPVGTVWIGVKYNNDLIVKKYIFKGNRKSIRQQTVLTALSILKKLLT